MFSDCKKNNNKYYVLQMLENKQTGNFYLLTRFGRVGENGKLSCDLQSQDAARKNYAKTLRQKTRKGYTKIDMKLGDDNDPVKPQIQKVQSDYATSKLPDSVQELMKFIYDTQLINKTLELSEYDVKKLPLGQLSD